MEFSNELWKSEASWCSYRSMNLQNDPKIKRLIEAFVQQLYQAQGEILLQVLRRSFDVHPIKFEYPALPRTKRAIKGDLDKPRVKLKNPTKKFYVKPREKKLLPSVSEEVMDKVRIELVSSNQKLTSTEIAEKSGLGETTVRAALKQLEKLDTVISTEDGRRILYSVP